MQFDWKPFSTLDKNLLSATRSQYHQAIQAVSAVGRKFLPESSHDENATLIWVPGLTRLAGKWVKGKKTFRSSIGFEDFCIYLVDEKVNLISKFSLNGKAQSQVLIWLEEQVGKLALVATDLTMNLPYSLPKSVSANGDEFAVDLEQSLEFAKYFNNSYIAIKELAEQRGIKSPKIVTWPHHFDQAMSITVKETGDAATNSSMLVGMSPGDEEYDEPYLYVNSWPHIPTGGLPNLKNGAIWHEKNWTGAVLLASHFAGKKDEQELFRTFYQETTAIIEDRLLS